MDPYDDRDQECPEEYTDSPEGREALARWAERNYDDDRE